MHCLLEPKPGSHGDRRRNMKCVKVLLYVLLLTCCICAVGLIAVGLEGAKLDVNPTINQGATSESPVPVVIIAMGVCLLLVAFVGCMGPARRTSVSYDH